MTYLRLGELRKGWMMGLSVLQTPLQAAGDRARRGTLGDPGNNVLQSYAQRTWWPLRARGLGDVNETQG